MGKKKIKQQNNSLNKKRLKKTMEKEGLGVIPGRLKKWIGAILMMLSGIIVAFSFFEEAGVAGQLIFQGFHFLIGKTVFCIPFLLFAGAFFVIKPQKKRVLIPVFCGLLLLILGISAILAVNDTNVKQGGWLGYIFGWPFFNYFGLKVSLIIFSTLILIGALILWDMMPKRKKVDDNIEETKDKKAEFANAVKTSPELKKPKFELKPVEIFQNNNKLTSKIIFKKTGPEKAKSEAIDTSIFDNEYKVPPLDLLDTVDEKPSSGDTEYNALAIKRTLQNFGIPVEMSEINVGPTVTQYTLKPAEGVKLSKITTLNNDLALALASHPIRIEAPVPGRSLVGIEVPNKTRARVKVGSLISEPYFQKSISPLTFALGKDVMGMPLYADLDKMPHLLVAGSTGSGKTICLNSVILSLVFRNSPKILRLILIDPKRVEFPIYGALPHLLTPVILDSRKAVNVLNWLVGEMERRFEVLREFGARDISFYNKTLQQKPKKMDDGFRLLPYIVLVIDELADLMMAKGKDVEASIVRLSQLSRAVGIHLIVATQRPSVEVITGLIKANITSRIAFQVASQIDSRTILDTAGAEKLLGRGDMLFLSSEFSRPKRLQGGFLTPPEIKKVVDFIVKENTPEEREDISETIEKELEQSGGMGVATEESIVNFSAKDPLYEEAKEIVIQYKKASASLLQRRLQIGYARAARILDELEENKFIGQADGAKPREVYGISRERDENKDGFEDPGNLTF